MKIIHLIAFAIIIIFFSCGGKEINNGTDTKNKGKDSLKNTDPALVTSILDMGSWSKEKIEETLSETNFDSISNKLVKNLESVLIEQAQGLVIDNPKKLMSFFIAHQLVNLWDASLAANDATREYGPHGIKSDWDIIRDAGDQIVVKNKMWLAEHAIEDKIMNEVRELLSQKDKTSLKEAFAKLQLKKGDNIYKPSIHKLSKLIVLAKIGQSEFQKKYLLMAYNAALTVLNKDNSFNLSKSDIINKIAVETWLKPELKNNPFVLSLKNIMNSIVI